MPDARKGVGVGLAIAGAGAAVAGVVRRRRAVAPSAVAASPPDARALPPAAAAPVVDGLLTGSRDIAAGVSDVYRQARRAFGRTAGEDGAPDLAELEQGARDLWCAATFAEPFGGREARRLARRARALLDAIAERRELDALRDAAQGHRETLGTPSLARLEEFAQRRGARLDERILDRGRDLFALKPARLARQLAGERDG
jgi:hypothetical protein